MADLPDREEHYLLRVQDKALADRLRRALRQPAASESSGEAPIDLKFSTSGGADPEARTGELMLDGQAYAVKRQDLPTVVECFKTYDHVNLVKCGDVGQVILVPDRSQRLPEGVEARHGVTPPMRDARRRRFRRSRDVDPGFMRAVEEAVLLIASGSAPEGYQFVDEEEEYVVAEDGKSGRWQPCKPRTAAAAAAPAAPASGGPKKRAAPTRRPRRKQAETPEPSGGASQQPEASAAAAATPGESLGTAAGDGEDV